MAIYIVLLSKALYKVVAAHSPSHAHTHTLISGSNLGFSVFPMDTLTYSVALKYQTSTSGTTVNLLRELDAPFIPETIVHLHMQKMFFSPVHFGASRVCALESFSG